MTSLHEIGPVAAVLDIKIGINNSLTKEISRPVYYEIHALLLHQLMITMPGVFLSAVTIRMSETLEAYDQS